MTIRHLLAFLLFGLALAAVPGKTWADGLETRIAIVIGNSAYPANNVPTAANDAGLIAQTLQAAGFDVVGARDLDMNAMRSALKEFVDKARSAGPQTIAVVYFAGLAQQFEGENYVEPIDARVTQPGDIPLEAIRVSDITKSLSALPLKARMIILDAADSGTFEKSATPLAGGLALMQPEDGMLIAFNAAPGTLPVAATTGYTFFATALAEMIKEGGQPLDALFERVRLRVSELSGGTQVTWNVSRITTPFQFFAHTADGPKPTDERFAELRSKPVAQFPAQEAYLAALARDTIKGYEEFLAAYPDDRQAKRVRAILASRREAATWRESVQSDRPNAYWSYTRRYPHGPHVYEARLRLNHFAVAFDPPPTFEELAYDIAPPPREEIFYVERPVIYFADPVYELLPPPPVPVFFLVPRPVYFVELLPPQPPILAFVLPTPIYFPVAPWVERPVFVVPPPVNIININIHNRVVINQVANTVAVTTPTGTPVPVPVPASASARPTAAAGLAATAVALPLALRNRTPASAAVTKPAQPQPLPLLLPPGAKPVPANIGQPIGKPLASAPAAAGQATTRPAPNQLPTAGQAASKPAAATIPSPSQAVASQRVQAVQARSQLVQQRASQVANQRAAQQVQRSQNVQRNVASAAQRQAQVARQRSIQPQRRVQAPLRSVQPRFVPQRQQAVVQQRPRAAPPPRRAPAPPAQRGAPCRKGPGGCR